MNAHSEVMIVEDEAIISLALSQHLKEFGYNVVDVVHSGEAAIRRSLEEKPDIILMDIVLKGDIDGITAAKEINAVMHIPVIYLTAYSDEETVERAVDTAPYGYITKPYDPGQIRAAIETAISKAQLEKIIRDSEQWYISTLYSIGDAVIATDPDCKIRFMNPAAALLTETTFEDAKGKNVAEVVKFEPADFTESHNDPVEDALNTGKPQSIDFGTNIISANGYRTPIDDSVAPIFEDDGNLMGIVMVMHDVSKEMELRKNIEASEHRFQSAFMQAATGCALVELDDSLRQVNPALAKWLGYSIEELESLSFLQILHTGYHDKAFEYNSHLIENKVTRFQEEWEYMHRDGSIVWGLTSGALIFNDREEPEYFIYQICDISDRIHLESKLVQLANYDSLTGLVNRSRLRLEIQRAIATARRYHEKFALLFIDLDDFKHVNDSLGHDCGDTLLQEIGERLLPMARETDVVARLGGDEFVVLVNGISNPQDIIAIADKIRVSIARPVTVSGKELRVSASVGISIYPEDGESGNTLLRNADSALYKAKAEGRSTIAFYSTDLTERTSQRLDLETKLKSALELDQFTLFYQPVIDLASRKIYCFEALIRWKQGEEIIYPDRFIPLAEETGLIVSIGNWVLKKACRQAVEWENFNLGKYVISVNVSTRQIREPGFVQFVSDVLVETGLDAGRLWLEITENLLVGVDSEAGKVLEELRKLGIALTIDDFGVGYSSLSYLKHLNPRNLKIDRSFINDVSRDQEDAAIVSATIAMAQRLGINVIAEGIENEEQLTFLDKEGCGAVQGDFFSKPIPGKEVPSLLEK